VRGARQTRSRRSSGLLATNRTTRSGEQWATTASRILSEYRADVADYDPETYYGVYEERLEPFLAETTGREHYQTVVGSLEEMRELGFDDDLEAFVAHLKKKHSNRPAFLDEMEALDGG